MVLQGNVVLSGYPIRLTLGGVEKPGRGRMEESIAKGKTSPNNLEERAWGRRGVHFRLLPLPLPLPPVFAFSFAHPVASALALVAHLVASALALVAHLVASALAHPYPLAEKRQEAKANAKAKKSHPFFSPRNPRKRIPRVKTPPPAPVFREAIPQSREEIRLAESIPFPGHDNGALHPRAVPTVHPQNPTGFYQMAYLPVSKPFLAPYHKS